MPDRRNAGRLAWWPLVLLVPALLSCRTPGEKRRRAMDTATLLAAARAAQDAGDPVGMLRNAETLLQRELTPDEAQESLFLAGRGRFLCGREKAAFRHDEELIQDYPYSRFLPLIEGDVYTIGRHALAGKPGWLFGDLFSGRPFGVEVLRLFTTTFTASDRADDALNLVADYYFGREEYDFAGDKYDLIVRQHPDSEWYDLARYRSALCPLRASRGAGYDDTLLRQARRGFLAYLSRPGAYQEEAAAGLRESEEALARTQFLIARFHLIRHQERGARLHLANAVLLYPDTPAAAEARTILEENGWDTSLNSLDALGPAGGTRSP